jgi:hypothetical protein
MFHPKAKEGRVTSPRPSSLGDSHGTGVERSRLCPRHRGRAAARGPRPHRPRGRANRTEHSEHRHGCRPAHGAERPPSTPEQAPSGEHAEHGPARGSRTPGGVPRSGPGASPVGDSRYSACLPPRGRRPGARRYVPAPGVEPGNSAADIPDEPGRYRAPLPLGQRAWCRPRRLGPVRTPWGDHTSLQPRSAPPVKGRLLVGGVVSPRSASRPLRPPSRVRGARAELV